MSLNDLMQEKRTKHLIQTMRQSIEAQDTLQQQEMQQQEMQRQAQEQLQQEEQLRQQEQPAPVVQEMGTQADIAVPAEPVQKEGFRARKKREEREKAARAAETQKTAVLQQEEGLLEQRVQMSQSETLSEEQLRNERALLSEKLKAIDLQEKAQMLGSGDAPLTEAQQRRVHWEAQAARAKAAGEYARMLPVGSAMRRKAMAVKEEQELKADKLRRSYKVTTLENPVERAREEATLKRHDRYDKLKSIFRKENPLSHEDAVWRHPGNGHMLINVGRAFFGGTKPMYIFEDRESPIIRDGRIAGYKQYLFKEAINCVGFDKPEGALVTEAAARLQDILCGPYSIPAFSAQVDGKVLGSFQEKIESRQGDDRIDLFSWQASTQAGEQIDLPEGIKNEILREHTLDWLLCNFDTKGENFLHRQEDGHLCSFDKEASFGRLQDEGARHMSTDYKPHANDTLYNTIFTEYARGRIHLDLSGNLEQIERMEAMSRQDYLALFTAMLDQKYGPAGPRNTARQAAEDAICERKENLREEYRQFYEGLIERRKQAMGAGDDTRGLLDAAGRFRFRGEPPSAEGLP